MQLRAIGQLLSWCSLVGLASAVSVKAEAGSCCARSPAAPFLIVGDDRYQANLGLTSTSNIAEADRNGTVAYAANDVSDRIWNYRVEGALLLSDLFQAGVSFPMVTRTRNSSGATDSSTGIGDVRFSLGYEVLPAWNYSKWKPQGFLFGVVSVPTGRSMYEAQSPVLADIRGNGFLGMSVGGLFLKRWARWDSFFIVEGHYSFTRTFPAEFGPSYSVTPGLGGSMGVGLGWSPGGGRLRLGVRIQPRVDQLEQVQRAGVTPREGVRWATDVGFDMAFMVAQSDTLMLSFTDQTLVGPSVSAPLSRAVGLSFQHRWER